MGDIVWTISDLSGDSRFIECDGKWGKSFPENIASKLPLAVPNGFAMVYSYSAISSIVTFSNSSMDNKVCLLRVGLNSSGQDSRAVYCDLYSMEPNCVAKLITSVKAIDVTNPINIGYQIDYAPWPQLNLSINNVLVTPRMYGGLQTSSTTKITLISVGGTGIVTYPTSIPISSTVSGGELWVLGMMRSSGYYYLCTAVPDASYYNSRTVIKIYKSSTLNAFPSTENTSRTYMVRVDGSTPYDITNILEYNGRNYILFCRVVNNTSLEINVIDVTGGTLGELKTITTNINISSNGYSWGIGSIAMINGHILLSIWCMYNGSDGYNYIFEIDPSIPSCMKLDYENAIILNSNMGKYLELTDVYYDKISDTYVCPYYISINLLYYVTFKITKNGEKLNRVSSIKYGSVTIIGNDNVNSGNADTGVPLSTTGTMVITAIGQNGVLYYPIRYLNNLSTDTEKAYLKVSN